MNINCLQRTFVHSVLEFVYEEDLSWVVLISVGELNETDFFFMVTDILIFYFYPSSELDFKK